MEIQKEAFPIHFSGEAIKSRHSEFWGKSKAFVGKYVEKLGQFKEMKAEFSEVLYSIYELSKEMFKLVCLSALTVVLVSIMVATNWLDEESPLPTQLSLASDWKSSVEKRMEQRMIDLEQRVDKRLNKLPDEHSSKDDDERIEKLA